MSKPGRLLRRMASRCLGEPTMTRLVDPVIADWQAEYADAVGQRLIWKSRWIRYSGYAVFAKTLVVHGAWGLSTSLRGWSGEDSGALRRMVGISTAATVALVGFFAYIPIWNVWALHSRVALIGYLLPQAIPVASPIGLLLGILYVSRRSGLSRRVVAAGVVAALAVCLASFTLLSEVIPSANQAFRVTVYRTLNPTAEFGPSRSRAEMTFAELRQRVQNASQWASTEHEVRMLAFDYYQKRALAFAALPLSVLALVVRTRRRFGIIARGTIGVAAVALYYSVMVATLLVSESALAWLAVWLPHFAVLLLLAAILAVRPLPAALDARTKRGRVGR